MHLTWCSTNSKSCYSVVQKELCVVHCRILQALCVIITLHEIYQLIQYESGHTTYLTYRNHVLLNDDIENGIMG